MPLKINIITILVSMLVCFFIQMIWYTAIFAKPWMKEMGYDPNMKPDRKSMMKGMLLTFIGTFLFSWVLAFYLAGWKFIPGATEMTTLATALNSAISVWAGFFVPVHLSRVVWEKHSWKLFFINSGYHLVAAMVVSFILSYWT
jgi:Protein of unknown function (DUF1761)